MPHKAFFCDPLFLNVPVFEVVWNNVSTSPCALFQLPVNPGTITTVGMETLGWYRYEAQLTIPSDWNHRLKPQVIRWRFCRCPANAYASIVHRLCIDYMGHYYGSLPSHLLSHYMSLLRSTKSCLGCAVLVTVVTSDVPKEGTEDCEGIGREMERVAERMGGTTKWPYNDSDCLDAAPWFRPEQRHFTCILHIFAHQFWTRRPAERKGVASRSSHIISMFVWECSDFPTVMNGDGQVWSSMVKGTQWFYLWKRMTSAEFGDNSGLCCTQVWPEEKFKLVADSLIKDILWAMPSMLFAFTVVHFILWNGLLHPFIFF